MSVKKSSYVFTKVPLPHTPGMDALEHAFHVLDVEAENLKEWPDELLYRLSQLEHCYSVLFIGLLRHLPDDIRATVAANPPPMLDAFAQDPLDR